MSKRKLLNKKINDILNAAVKESMQIDSNEKHNAVSDEESALSDTDQEDHLGDEGSDFEL